MKKRIYSLIAVFVIGSLVIQPLPANAATFSVGNGNNLIESKAELLELLKGDSINRNQLNFTLATDIDLGGASIQPLRINDGTIDGAGHTISNFKIEEKNVPVASSQKKFAGFVGLNRGTIKNLHFVNVKITAPNFDNVGAVVGSNNSTTSKAVIENVTLENVTVTGKGDVGGIAGNNVSQKSNSDALITNCSVIGTATIRAHMTTGCLAGFSRGLITKSTVNVTGTSSNVDAVEESGVFIGENEGVIRNCTSNGTVSGSKVEIGGFVGDNDGKVYDSKATGQVTGPKDTAGFAGANSGTISGSSTSCNVTSNMSGKAYIGGFVGLNDKGNISNSSANGSVKAKGEIVGGFVGMAISKGSLFKNCTVGSKDSMPQITGKVDVGGFIGSNSGTRGLVKIQSCVSYANVKGNKNVGGFVGKNFGKNGYIYKSNANSKIKGKTNVGAFVGYNASGGRILSSKKNKSKVTGKKSKFAGKNRGQLKKCK